MQRIPDHNGGASVEAPILDRPVALSGRVTAAAGTVVFHPFLLAAYPILALLGQNAREVRFEALSRLIGVVVLATLAIWVVLSLVLRDARKAGIVASLAVVLFFPSDMALSAANSAFNYASDLWVRTVADLNVCWVAIPELLLLAAAAILLKTRLNDARRVTMFLNIFSAVLISIPLAEFVSVKTPSVGHTRRQPVPFSTAAKPGDGHRPDIYYIILDGYAHTDTMKSFFDFDNSPFLDRLEKQGFYVARDSIANYCQTALSLSGSLNADYLEELVKGLGNDQTELTDLVGKNNVVASLKPLGYKFVTFATGFDPTDHPEADVYLSPHPFANGFERMVIDITPLHWIWPNPRNLNPVEMSRERTFFLLDHLPDVAADRSPTFTLAHVFCPHPPLIYGPNGEDVHLKYVRYAAVDGDRIGGRYRDPEFFAKGYGDQAAFITDRIEATIKQIMARSPEPPIIILQSDHGSELKLDVNDVNNTDVKERMRILNAYYFPERKYGGLYSGISPVNTFRVVLNTFFGAQIKLLTDRSFFSTWGEPYRFIDVTDRVRSPEPEPVSVNH
jgi:hypothetical protein